MKPNNSGARKSSKRAVANTVAAKESIAAAPVNETVAPASTNKPAVAAPAATPSPFASEEAKLRHEQLEIQVAQARLDLAKRQRDEKVAAELANLDLQQKRNALEKSALELATARRLEANAASTDFENGEFMFCEPVTWDTAKASILELNKLSRRFPRRPLTITDNSPGGSVIAGLALYDHIQELRTRGHYVTVKCRGMAASMGGILLQAGDKRIIGKESRVLIHEVSSGTSGKIGDMEDDLAFSKQLWVSLSKILAKRSKMTATQIRAKAHKFDWWLSAQEAVKLGFADEIG